MLSANNPLLTFLICGRVSAPRRCAGFSLVAASGAALGSECSGATASSCPCGRCTASAALRQVRTSWIRDREPGSPTLAGRLYPLSHEEVLNPLLISHVN